MKRESRWDDLVGTNHVRKLVDFEEVIDGLVREEKRGASFDVAHKAIV